MRQTLVIKCRFVALDGVHRNHEVRAQLGFDQPARIARDNGNSAQHGFHHHQPETFEPERRNQQDARVFEHLIDALAVTKQREIRAGFERAPVLRGRAPTG